MNAFGIHRGFTPLMYAAKFGNVKLISRLLNAGSSETLKNDYGHTAREIAEMNGFVEVYDEATTRAKSMAED